MKNNLIRILHSASLLRPPTGITKQMAWELDSAKALDIPWNVKMFAPQSPQHTSEIFRQSESVKSGHKNPFKKAIDWIRIRKEYHRWLLDQADDYDVFLLRYYVHDPFQLMFVLKSKKPVYFVCHTLEVPELAQSGFFGKIRAILETIIGKYSLRAAAGIIGVTNEIVHYELSRAKTRSSTTIVYPNGINCNSNPISDNRDSIPQFIFISSFFYAWHGLDLLLDSLAKHKSVKLKLHLVGELSQTDKTLSASDPRIVVHGKLNSKEIIKIAEKCHLGLSSFALHRNKMQEACTLKVREYLTMGLPVYAGYKEMLPDDFMFYHQGKPDIPEIINFYRSLNNPSRKSVADQAKPFIDKRIILQKLYTDINMASKKA